jgi:hypothetical protein
VHRRHLYVDTDTLFVGNFRYPPRSERINR